MIVELCTALPQFDFGQQQNTQQMPFEFNQQQLQFNFRQPPQQLQQPQQSTTIAPVLDRAFYKCFDNCPTLSQYNPVCGSDGLNYHNDQKLRCHNECGQRSNANWTRKLAFSILSIIPINVNSQPYPYSNITGPHGNLPTASLRSSIFLVIIYLADIEYYTILCPKINRHFNFLIKHILDHSSECDI